MSRSGWRVERCPICRQVRVGYGDRDSGIAMLAHFRLAHPRAVVA